MRTAGSPTKARCDASRWRQCTFADIIRVATSVPPSSSRTPDTGSRARSDPVPSVDQLVAPDHDQLAQAVDAHVLDQLVELPAGQ